MEVLLLLFLSYMLYEYKYFKSKSFLDIKNNVEKYIIDCNDLNLHIEELKRTYIGTNQLDYGSSDYYDNSIYNYKRPELKKQKYAPYIYSCSRNVCDSARKQPFKYICKYFNLKPNEDTLEKIENVLNNFEAAEEGKIRLRNEKKKIIERVKKEVPFLIRNLSSRKLEKKLGFEKIDFTKTYFPKYIFHYISPGGNASMQCDVIMDIENLNRFVTYLSGIIKFNKSVEGQRALMTSSLRRKIKERDGYKCRYCKISLNDEPNLLLEIDHIIPLSKGGLTIEDNLQTLCWKCNRSKGTKLYLNEYDVEKNKIDILCIPSKTEIEKQYKNETKNKLTNIDLKQNSINEKKENNMEIKNNMYDEKKGVYPSGQYLVGEDIETGRYLVNSREDFTGTIAIYESYSEYKKDEMLSFYSFKGDYHLSLRENGVFLVLEYADMQRL